MDQQVTVSRELLRQVLTRLELGGPEWERDNMITALRAALEQPAPREHMTDDSQCWCNPETVYTDPDTGASVIIHKEPQ